MVVSASDYIKHTKFQNAEKFYQIWVKKRELYSMYAHVR